MPYRRRFKKRTWRRKRSTLSTRNIFSRTGAKSQATQIAALRRRINKVYRATKPERKQILTTTANITFSSESGGTVEHTYNSESIQPGNTDTGRIGDKIFRKDTWYFSLEYYNNSDTGYHNSESSGCVIRVICGKWKVPHAGGNGPSPFDLIENYASSGSGYTCSSIAPLKASTTEDKIIFSDRRYVVSTEKNQRVIRVSTPWYTNRFSDHDHSPSDGWSDHSWCLLLVAGLHWDSNFTEYVNGSTMKKTVFTDA